MNCIYIKGRISVHDMPSTLMIGIDCLKLNFYNVVRVVTIGDNHPPRSTTSSSYMTDVLHWTPLHHPHVIRRRRGQTEPHDITSSHISSRTPMRIDGAASTSSSTRTRDSASLTQEHSRSRRADPHDHDDIPTQLRSTTSIGTQTHDQLTLREAIHAVNLTATTAPRTFISSHDDRKMIFPTRQLEGRSSRTPYPAALGNTVLDKVLRSYPSMRQSRVAFCLGRAHIVPPQPYLIRNPRRVR
jgi:hypothetical protein